MADTKISALTALTGANTANTDVLPIVDVDANATKKITVAELTSKVGIGGTAVDLTGLADGDGLVYDSGTSSFVVADVLPITPGTPADGDVLTYDSGTSTYGPAAPTGGGATSPLFGDGFDGDVTISGDTTLTSDMYYNNLTVNAATNLTTGGFRIFVKGTLTLNGTIRFNGVNATSTVGASAGGSNQTLRTTESGGAGDTAAGTAGTARSDCMGGAGGAGGTGSGGAGGAGGAATVPAANRGGVRAFGNPAMALIGRFFEAANAAAILSPFAGLGGGGGGGDGTAGGGGGGGGGFVFVAARLLAGTGTIEAKGGNGFAAAAGNRGGGGGGGGGVITLITSSTSNPYTLNVDGGTGGAGAGTGTAGSNGSAGRTFVHVGA